jgi:hypothetical protein
MHDELEEPENDFAAPPRIPLAVRTAGIIWIVVGSLILLAGVVVLLVSMGTVAANKGLAARGGDTAYFVGVILGQLAGVACVALFGAAFLFVGVKSVTGTAGDTLGNGIGSIVFGALNLGGAALFAGAGRFIQSGVSLIYAGCLIAAGVLALVGRADYKEWRRFQIARRRARDAAWWGIERPGRRDEV